MLPPGDDPADGGTLPGGVPPDPPKDPPADANGGSGSASGGAPPTQTTVVQAAPNNTVAVQAAADPSTLVFTFIRAVLHHEWSSAFSSVNGLSMTDMLKGMAALDRLDLADLMAQQAGFASAVYMPRIQYAADVINNQALPATAPGDLEATKQVQDARNYLAKHPRLRILSDLTGTLPDPNPAAPLATEADFQSTATALGVETATVHAITDVESGRPFGQDGRPTIRYELHVFYAQVVGLMGAPAAEGYKRTHPHLCQAHWHDGDPYHAGGQPNEWSMLYGAMILRPGMEAALLSASYGSFQIMGKYFDQTGAADVARFVSNEFVSQGNQLNDFAGVVRARNLVAALRTHDWASFALHYNGQGYRDNHYDTNLAAAYARRSSAH
jgi:hypothetical protein